MSKSPKPPQAFQSSGRSRKGEPWVWLTAGGLTLGVIMALGLLLLILLKGMSSFWPRRIDMMQVQTADKLETVAGYVTQERTKRVDGVGYVDEIQIFRGNKDVNGQAFLFIDKKQIKSTSRPEELMLVERKEYGHAIVIPVALVTPTDRIEATDEDFSQAVDAAIERAAEVRDRILHLERKEIGRNSMAIKDVEKSERIGELAPEEARKLRAELEAEYERLQAQVAIEETKLEGHAFISRTVGGAEITIPVEELYGVFESNRASLWQRLVEMLHRIWNFLVEEPRQANMEGGVYPAIFGTVVMTLVMTLFVTPLGVIAAIYLREYAKQGAAVRVVRICVNNLAGVPSIVFGVFGLAFFVYTVGKEIDNRFYSDELAPVFGTGGILWASLTLALLTLPVVIVATEEALAAVPRGVREAALACGASKWQTIQRIVIPASLPGILTGVILAMARGAGEVAPLMIVGVVKYVPTLPIDDIAPFVHPERKFMHLGFHIYDLGMQSPDSEAAKPMVYATALLLITIVLMLNLAAIIIRNRLKKKFAVSHF